jgi:hypothetical protein
MSIGTFDFPSPADRRVIQACSGLLMAWGIINVIFRRRAFVVNLNISLISLAIVAPLIGEIFIRSAITLRREKVPEQNGTCLS